MAKRNVTRCRTSLKLNRELKALFEHEHGKLCAVVSVISFNEEGITIEGHFETRRGKFVGRFCRVLTTPENELRMEHEEFTIYSPWCNHGWGAEWYRECERRYREFGIDSITLGAGHSHGGYVWAREGFVFGGKRQVENFWQDQECVISRLEREEHISIHQAERWRRLIRLEELDTPQKILQLGRRQRWQRGKHTFWPGKYLLWGSKWEGIKVLRSTEGAAQAAPSS